MIVCGVFFDEKFSGHLIYAQDVEGLKNQIFTIFSGGLVSLLRSATVREICQVKEDGTVTADFLKAGLPVFECAVIDIVNEKASELVKVTAAIDEEVVHA